MSRINSLVKNGAEPKNRDDKNSKYNNRESRDVATAQFTFNTKFDLFIIIKEEAERSQFFSAVTRKPPNSLLKK